MPSKNNKSITVMKQTFWFSAFSIHSKKCWVVLTQFWVKYGQTQMLG